MRTDDLVNLLATGDGTVPRHAVGRRYAIALPLGTAASFALMICILGVRPDLAEAIHLPMFWVKLVFAACLAGASLVAALRLSQPGRRLTWVPAALASPVLLMWTIALLVLVRADPAQRLGLTLGSTWTVCPFLIAMLSVPVYIAAMWAMRGLAPTHLRLAGSAAGLLAGSLGTLVYCLHCPELEAPFVGTWYLLGILIPTLAGALSGRSLLRW